MMSCTTYRRSFAAILLLTVAATVGASPLPADAIQGVWQTRSGGYIQIHRDNGAYVGTVVGSADGQARYDRHNPDADKQGRRLLGVTLLHGLKSEGNGQYDDGTIYDPENGKSYHAKATLKDHDTLDARGYIGVSLLGKTQTWHRIDPDAPHVHADLLHRPVGDAPDDGAGS